MSSSSVEFDDALNAVLPADLPHREMIIRKASEHLALIVEANRFMNLTRITTPREAAIKHVLDSVIPWRLLANAEHVLDAGTGAGFPGIPLALALPGVRFTLAESVQKKARFVESALAKLQLPNVSVRARRAEELAGERPSCLIVARALAPVSRAIGLFGPALRAGKTALLYKGPDAAREICEAGTEARKYHVRTRIVMSYDLPERCGARTIVEIAPAPDG